MNTNVSKIEQAVKRGYIEGIHKYQDKEIVLEGFHEDFEMIVLSGGEIEKVNIDKWLDRVEGMKAQNPEMWQAETTCSFELLDSTRDTASVKIDVYKGNIHFSTDYMLLYNIGGEWKIVSKIYSVPK